MNRNELDQRAGDFGWIVSADVLCPEVTTLRDITAALRFEALEYRASRRSMSAPAGCATASPPLSRPTPSIS